MIRITTEDKILCLSCGENSDEVLISLEDRPELIGESCSACGRIVRGE